MKTIKRVNSQLISIEVPRITYSMTIVHNKRVAYRNFFSDFSKSIRKVESRFIIDKRNIIKGKKFIIEYTDGTAQNVYMTQNETILSADVGTF